LATYYGALSDRKGRLPVLLVAGLGNIFMMICYLLTIRYHQFFGISLLFLAPAVKGILAGDSVMLAAAQAYISDCTTPTERYISLVMSYPTVYTNRSF
jgi:MFS family permease